MEYCLVLGGGGVKGAYQIGVFQGLITLKVPITCVIGTSVGALNGSLFIQNDLDRGFALWDTIKGTSLVDSKLNFAMGEHYLSKGNRKHFFLQFLLHGGLNTTPLKGLIQEKIDPVKILTSPMDFGIVMTHFPWMKPYVVFKEEMKEDSLVDFLMATSACFPIFKPYGIKGKGLCIDGAFYDNLPIGLGIKRGYKNIIAVDLQSLGVKRQYKEKGVNILSIASKNPLPGLLEFHKNKIEYSVYFGYFDCLKAFKKREGNQYTFYLGELEKLFSLFNNTNLFFSKGLKISFLEEIGTRLHLSKKKTYTAKSYRREIKLHLMNKKIEGRENKKQDFLYWLTYFSYHQKETPPISCNKKGFPPKDKEKLLGWITSKLPE